MGDWDWRDALVTKGVWRQWGLAHGELGVKDDGLRVDDLTHMVAFRCSMLNGSSN